VDLQQSISISTRAESLGADAVIPLAMIIDIFHETYGHMAVLKQTDVEPLYDPNHNPPAIYFMRASLPSLLHELSHWCVASGNRLKLVDYGYWYEPDGRSPHRQAEFESFEARPQAIELLLSVAIGRDFVVSFDNLSAGSACRDRLVAKILKFAHDFIDCGLPPRAEHLKTLFLCASNLNEEYDRQCQSVKTRSVEFDSFGVFRA
jgi:elongation factor P hydroxylase